MGIYLFLADGEGFEPPVELPPQRFSRPPHSTALPPIRNYFYRRSFNLRFCSLDAPGGAAHHSFARGCALLALLTRMQDRRIRPLCHPSETIFTDGLSTYGFVRFSHLSVLLTTRSFSTSLCLSRRLVCKTAAIAPLCHPSKTFLQTCALLYTMLFLFARLLFVFL